MEGKGGKERERQSKREMKHAFNEISDYVIVNFKFPLSFTLKNHISVCPPPSLPLSVLMDDLIMCIKYKTDQLSFFMLYMCACVRARHVRCKCTDLNEASGHIRNVDFFRIKKVRFPVHT